MQSKRITHTIVYNILFSRLALPLSPITIFLINVIIASFISERNFSLKYNGKMKNSCKDTNNNATSYHHTIFVVETLFFSTLSLKNFIVLKNLKKIFKTQLVLKWAAIYLKLAAHFGTISGMAISGKAAVDFDTAVNINFKIAPSPAGNIVLVHV